MKIKGISSECDVMMGALLLLLYLALLLSLLVGGCFFSARPLIRLRLQCDVILKFRFCNLFLEE